MILKQPSPLLYSGLLFVLSGCLSVQNDNQLYQVESIAEAGNYRTAYQSARATAEKKAKSHHRLIWRLHEGYLAYWAGEASASISAFDMGAKELRAYENRPSLSARDIGSQMLSLLTSPGSKPYKGTVVEGILLHTYKGLAHAQEGDLSSAMAELREAAHRRKSAHDHFRRQLEQAAKRDRGLPGGWRDRPEVKEALDDAYGDVALLPHYQAFTNPLQVHLEAIFASHHGSSQNREHARKLWSTLLAMNSNQTLIKSYRDWAESRHKNPSLAQPVVHLLHERGQAPELLNDSISLALPVNGRLTGIHLAFADLVVHPDNLPPLKIQSPENPNPQPLASLDALMVAERKTKDTGLLLEQIGAALTKAVAEYQLAKKDELLGLGLTLFNASINRADTRSWTTLPKNWEGALIPSPPERLILGMGSETLELKVPDPSGSWLLHLKSVGNKHMTHHWIQLNP